MKLNVLKRNRPIQEIDLGKEVLFCNYLETVFLIGRSKNCHVVLDDKQISREHLKIIYKDGKWFVEKTSDQNMCVHNGEEFNHAELSDGDSLLIGAFTINVDIDSPVESSIIDKKSTSLLIPEPKVDSVAVVKNNEILPVVSNSKKMELVADVNDFVPLVPPEDPQVILETLPIENESNDVSYDENNDDAIEMSLGLSADLPLDAENSLDVVDEEKLSYSLENIESENAHDEDSTKVMQSFAKVQLELFGETAPYDKYLLEAGKTYIGRDEAQCQIVLDDSEVSLVHAVIIKNNVMVVLEDLNSSNGTILNGDRINKATLNHNDEFIIGGVTFTLKVRSEFLKEESSTLMAVDENQTVEIEEIVEVPAEEGENFDALGQLVNNAPEEKSFIKKIWKDDAKRKKAIYVLIGAVVAWVMLSDDSPPVPAAKSKLDKSKTTAKNANGASAESLPGKIKGKSFSEDDKRALSARYEIGKNHYYNGRYREALEEFQRINSVDPHFNASLQSLISLSKDGLSKLEEQEKKRLAEQALAEKKIKVKELVAKAAEFVKEHRAELAKNVFDEIAKLDPENIEVTKMKLDLEDWQKEKAKKELEEANKKLEEEKKKKVREDKVEKLKPGKVLFIQKEWFNTIGKLDDFLKIKEMDEDLIKEASDMLKVAHDEVNAAVQPLLGKAKSLLEGQDSKGAYEVYQQLLKIEPSNIEALNQVGEIKDQLSSKARKVYREAIISESIGLFQDAKEKFQEVQQISPVDSSYYKKATDKLKNYLD